MLGCCSWMKPTWNHEFTFARKRSFSAGGGRLDPARYARAAAELLLLLRFRRLLLLCAIVQSVIVARSRDAAGSAAGYVLRSRLDRHNGADPLSGRILRILPILRILRPLMGAASHSITPNTGERVQCNVAERALFTPAWNREDDGVVL